MPQGQGPDMPPWPVAPRPFFAECMGSWIGRVASCYKLSVEQLNSDYDLRLELHATRIGWLLMPPIEPQVLRGLADLARINVQWLQEIQTPARWMFDARSCIYCERCLFVNPADVTSPYWHRQWFRPDFPGCSIHSGTLETMAASKVRACPNLDGVLKSASKKARSRDFQRQFNLH